MDVDPDSDSIWLRIRICRPCLWIRIRQNDTVPFQATPDPDPQNGRVRARKKNYFCMEYSHNTTSTPFAKVTVTDVTVAFVQMPRTVIGIFLAKTTTFSPTFVGAKLQPQCIAHLGFRKAN